MKVTKRTQRFMSAAAMAALLLGSTPVLSDDDDDEVPFPVAVMIIELTEEDIEIQIFVDGHWGNVKMYDPRERKIFGAGSRGKLRRQDGVSEMFFASVPSHFLEDEPDFDEPIEDFLSRWPEGIYEFESRSLDGEDYESEVMFSHLMPDLPEIVAPVGADEDTVPIVSADDPLFFDWDEVEFDFLDGNMAVEIVEYQLIVDEVDPERLVPWVDGETRRALINLPGDVTEFTLDSDFLVAGRAYEFEVLAIEENGNSSISVGEFETEE